jgi:hypothetical protein
VEKEVFEVTVEDTANVRTPFHFVGRVGVPRDTAKAMNRSTDGFVTSVNYINYPFISGDSSFNLAMKNISLSRKATQLKSEGGFKTLGRFESMKGYNAWRAHADSLLSGALKPKGLDLDYALKGEKAKEAAEAAGSGEGLDLGWRGWTRIAAFTATAAFGTLAVMKHLKATKHEDKFKDINKTMPAAASEYNTWYRRNYDGLKENVNGVKDNESSRNIFGIGAGVFAIAGALTFVF